jgi:hypothetical protein
VFLSYSRKDEGVVKALARGLEAARREVWFDHDLVGGDAWWDTILTHIRDTSVFIFALSDASLHSKPCRLELDYALALDRPILPVEVGPVESFRMSPVAELQVIRFRPADVQTGMAVLAAVMDVDQRPRPLPDPLPKPPPIPYGYLLALGRQIESTELSSANQIDALDQLRRALGEETDKSVRRDILTILRNLRTKPWRTSRTEREIDALLFVNTTRSLDDDGRSREAASEGTSYLAAAPLTSSEPVCEDAPPEPDPRAWFEERIATLAAIEANERPTHVISEAPVWRPEEPGRWRWAHTVDPGPGPVAPASSAGGWQVRNSSSSRSASPPTRADPPAHWFTPLPLHQPPSSEATWRPAAAPPQAPPPVRPRSNWLLGVIALPTVFFGVVALYCSAEVGRRFAAGDLTGAARASSRAGAWGTLGLIGDIVIVILLARLFI